MSLENLSISEEKTKLAFNLKVFSKPNLVPPIPANKSIILYVDLICLSSLLDKE